MKKRLVVNSGFMISIGLTTVLIANPALRVWVVIFLVSALAIFNFYAGFRAAADSITKRRNDL